MITRESVRAEMNKGPYSPRLIPKAYAFMPETEHPSTFRSYADLRVPIPALEKIDGTARPAPDRFSNPIYACSEAGAKHLKALEAAVHNAASLAILTIAGEPVATLKRPGYGQTNVLAFRHATLETENGIVHPLIPGGIYLPEMRTVIAASGAGQLPFIPIDGAEIYPASMFLEDQHPRTARRKYAYAETLFERLIGEYDA